MTSSVLQLRLSKLSNKTLAYNNMVYMHPSDMKTLGIISMQPLLINETIVHVLSEDENLEEGHLASSGLLWKALLLEPCKAVGTVVRVEAWQTSKMNQNLRSKLIVIVVDTYAKQVTEIRAEELEIHIQNALANQVFCKDQRWIMKWVQHGKDYWLNLRIANIHYVVDDDRKVDGDEDIADNNNNNNSNNEESAAAGNRSTETTRFAVLTPNYTNISLMAARNPMMKLIQPKGRIAGHSSLDWDPERLGIGGLDTQFAIIFRRAFASRLYPPEIVKQLGVKHVKGMLLHGPPGTGKTLIARNIGKMLTDNEPKVVNGPEILNKYVGASEEKIRELFEDAIVEQKQKGDESSLHIIIFDEIDAICKQRGSSGTGGSGVHDTVVNQLLSMIDGVNALNNVLVIGMTNRKDLLDDALTRSGRLEVHIEIGLPDEEGREQIFRIHTKSLRENGKFGDQISISSLAKRTKNYTGAEIEAVVRSAVSFAMQEFIDVENVGQIDVARFRNIMITQEYFDLALEEVKPELGLKNDDKMLFAYKRGIYRYNQKVTEIIELLDTIVSRMKRSQMMNRQAFLLTGEMGSGKTAMAAFLAHKSQFPFVRLISADNYVGASDAGVCASIAKIFSDAYKSNLSVIILDDIERLIGFTIGPRFSNAILQALLTCIRRAPSELGRKILVVGTCDPKAVRMLDFKKHFDFVRCLPTVKNQKEFAHVLREEQNKNHFTCAPSMDAVVEAFSVSKAGVGISHLLTVLELATDEQNRISSAMFSQAYNSKFGYDDDDDLFAISEMELDRM